MSTRKGLIERDKGAEKALIEDGWTREARKAMTALIDAGDPFTADMLTGLVGLPASRNKVGALVLAYAKAGRITRIGDMQSKRTDRHAGRVAVWVAA